MSNHNWISQKLMWNFSQKEITRRCPLNNLWYSNYLVTKCFFSFFFFYPLIAFEFYQTFLNIYYNSFCEKGVMDTKKKKKRFTCTSPVHNSWYISCTFDLHSITWKSYIPWCMWGCDYANMLDLPPKIISWLNFIVFFFYNIHMIWWGIFMY